MTLSKWIEDYCEENEIELPEDIPDEETALTFLGIASNGGGGGGGSSAVIIKDNGTALDKTFAEIYNLILSGTPCYVSYTEAKTSDDLDDGYTYHIELMPIVKVYKYNEDYRIACSVACMSAPGAVYNLQGPATAIYSAANASAYPSLLKNVYVSIDSLNTTDYRE